MYDHNNEYLKRCNNPTTGTTIFALEKLAHLQAENHDLKIENATLWKALEVQGRIYHFTDNREVSVNNYGVDSTDLDYFEPGNCPSCNKPGEDCKCKF